MKKWLMLALAAGTAALFTLPMNTTGGEEKIDFVGAAKCKMCHNKEKEGKFFDDWSKSHHAKAFDLLKDDEKKDPKCQKCHTTGFGEPGGFVSMEDKASAKMVGVQCEMCHGPGGLHQKSKKDNVIPHAWEPNAKTCEKCHNPESPTWKEDRYTTKDGKKVGFDYEQAVAKIQHVEVFKALGKEPKKVQ